MLRFYRIVSPAEGQLRILQLIQSFILAHKTFNCGFEY